MLQTAQALQKNMAGPMNGQMRPQSSNGVAQSAHFRNIMAAANSSMGDMSALNASGLPPKGG